jgi:hypothetical protein
VTESMTLEEAWPVSRRCRAAARAAVAAAVPLSLLRPVHLGRVLRLLRRGAAPAAAEQALAARTAVVAVSTHCAGQGCLRRSIATALVCRLRGSWPTWCVGVRVAPFRAHAWVETAGGPVGELHPAGYFVPVLTIPPVG